MDDHELEARGGKISNKVMDKFTEGTIEFGFTPDKRLKKRTKNVFGIVEQNVNRGNADLIDITPCQFKS